MSNFFAVVILIAAVVYIIGLFVFATLAGVIYDTIAEIKPQNALKYAHVVTPLIFLWPGTAHILIADFRELRRKRR